MEPLNEDWELLRTFFPPGWEELARKHDAVKGLRKDKSPEDLLRTLLIHVGCGLSLRETVVRAREANLAELSDVALLKRLRKCGPWLHQLCRMLFEERLSEAPTDRANPIYLLDASTVREPGKTGSQWRLHYSLSWPALDCNFFKLSPAEGNGNGESFARFPIEENAFYLADRAYSVPSGIRRIRDGGAYLAVRLNPNAVRLCVPGGQGMLFPLTQKLGEVSVHGEATQWPLSIADSKGREAAVGRLCVLVKSDAATKQAQAKLRSKAQKNGTSLRAETLEYAKFVMVFTTFPEELFPATAVLDWYRLRWQIELVFKRFKQIAGLGHLPKHDPESSKAWLHGKLFVALLTEKILAHARIFSPWGYEQQLPHAE